MSSESTDLAALERFFEKLALLPPPEPPTPNLFSEAGPGTKENRLSDLMAFFMGGYPGSPHWLAKALLHALVHKPCECKECSDQCKEHKQASRAHLQRINWEAITTEREVGNWNAESESTKRLDLVVSGTDFVLGIEHKVFSSAKNNLFDAYDNLLNCDEAKVYKCILYPDSSKYKSEIKDKGKAVGWEVLSYSELLESTYELYGQDVAPSDQTKWQIFYQELLQYLDIIARSKEAKSMTSEELNFTLRNFHHLFDSSQRLESLKESLMNKGEGVLEDSLDCSVNSKRRKSMLGDETFSLNFKPDRWGDGGEMYLDYYSYPEAAGEEKIAFEIYARVYKSPISLEVIQRKFVECAPVKKPQENVSWYIDNKEDDARLVNCDLLVLGVWPSQNTIDGAMQALGDLAKWVDKHAFPKNS